jgi:hypothetical protein
MHLTVAAVLIPGLSGRGGASSSAGTGARGNIDLPDLDLPDLSNNEIEERLRGMGT